MKRRATFLNRLSVMRCLPAVMIAVGLAGAALAQQPTFHNIADYEIPPKPGVIDATNFFNDNGALFIVTNFPDTASGLSEPFTTSDTLNYTNKGTIVANPGFDFEYFPTVVPPPQPFVPFNNLAGNFVNQAVGGAGGIIDCEGLAIFSVNDLTFANLANPKLIVGATNIVNTGTMTMDNSGLIDLHGEHLDLRHGTLAMSQNTLSASSVDFGIIDWGSGGFGTNSGFWGPGTQLTTTTAASAIFTNFNVTFIGQMFLNNSTPYIENINGIDNGLGTKVWRYIFLQDFSPANVTKNVYFGASGAGPGEFHIEWIGTNTDPVTGQSVPTYLYLSDDPAARRPTNYNHSLPPIEPFNPLGTFTLVSSAVQIPSGVLTPPTINNFTNPWANLVTNDFTYVTLQVGAAALTNPITGASVTNVAGRVQISASQDLYLANARINVPNYLSLSSPNFQGNTNALMSATFADLNLGVTNGSLTLSNLFNPKVPVWTGVPFAPDAVGDGMGGIQAWSGSFTNEVTNTFITLSNGVPITNSVLTTNDVRILLVNSDIQSIGRCFEQNVQLHAPNNLTIADDLNIFKNFFSDTQVLTITTNPASGPGGAFNADGQINLLSPDIFWSTALPNLQFFTNFGVFSSQNLTVFAGGLASPYDNPDLATPYQAFINHGAITNVGTFIRANTFENSGVIAEDFGGSIDIVTTSDSSLATNGQFLAPAGNFSITANSLLASNGIINAGGGPIILNLSCSLSDGYIFGNQFAEPTNAMFPHVVTNGNIWLTTGGIQASVEQNPGDLLGTTIEEFASNNFVQPSIWSGADRGTDVSGFGNNLAVGRVRLTADATSVFDFKPATVNGNAIYIDSLQFFGNTTNRDGNGNPLSIEIDSGMNVYYAEAIQNGVSIAEKLNGKFGAANTNGGHFYWVSNYAGVYSSTNIHYPDGNTYIFNHALAISPDIASGGPDGSQTTVANINNPTPIPTNAFYPVSISAPASCGGGGSGAGGSGTGGNSTNGLGSKVPAQLSLPSEAPGPVGGSNTFSIAAGNYNGLFYNTNAVKPTSSGYFSATVTPRGGFSAKLQLGSHSYSFSGSFDSSGAATLNNIGGKHLPALSVSLQLVNNDHITGSVSGNDWVSWLQADRAAFTARNGTPSAGKETLLLTSDDISTTSTGKGFATATISASGGVQVSATLPDGVKFTQKSALSKAGVWPVYASLYGGNGVLIGWMQCTNQVDVRGSAVWEMPGGAGGLYPGGLTNQIDAAGSPIQGHIPASAHYATILSGAGLGTSLTNNVAVSGKTVFSDNAALKLSVNPQTGLFSGSLVVPNSNQKLLFQGALLEKSGIGGGFFLNAQQSGEVYFGPAN